MLPSSSLILVDFESGEDCPSSGAELGHVRVLYLAWLYFSCAIRPSLCLIIGLRLNHKGFLRRDHFTNGSLQGRQLVKPNSLRCLIHKSYFFLTSAPDGTVHNFNFSSLASAAALVVTAASLYCLIKVSDCVRAAVVRNSSHPLCQILINLFKRRKRIIPSCPWKACFVFAKSANSLLSCVNLE